MSYWIGMASVLLIGYGLIKWSGRANEQADEGCTSSLGIGSAGYVGTRAVASLTRGKASDNSTNQGNAGGEE